MQTLKKQIKDKQIHGVYLFYGDEKFILNTYLDKMIQVTMGDGDTAMNVDIFDAGQLDPDKIIDALETLPFFSERRVVVLRELELLKSKNATKVDKLIPTFEKLPTSTVCFIIESEMDKRSKLYKTIQKVGLPVEFKFQTEEELMKYCAEQFHKKGKVMDYSVAKHFIQYVGFDLTTLTNEMRKLEDYVGDAPAIPIEAIEAICTRSVENKIFELVECMGSKRREVALSIYQDLLTLKEPPARILFMITRQFRLLLQTKLLSDQKKDRDFMLSKLKVPPFVLDKNMRQSKLFNTMTLKQALKKCLEAEADMKTGKMELEMGIEILIIEYSF